MSLWNFISNYPYYVANILNYYNKQLMFSGIFEAERYTGINLAIDANKPLSIEAGPTKDI